MLFDLPAKEGPKNGIVAEGDREPEEAEARAARRARGRRADPAGQLRGAPGPAGRLRPGDRGDRRAHGLEARPVQARSRRTWRRMRSSRANTSGLSITKLSRGAARGDQAALLRHPLLQPAALHGAGRADRRRRRPSREMLDQLEAFVTTVLGKSVVRAKDTPNFIANRVGIAGMLATMKEAENFGLSVRRGRRPDRQEARPRQLAAPSAPPTSSAWTRWRTSSRRCRTTWPDDPFFPSYATPPVLDGADRAGRAGPEDRRRLLQEGRQGHPAPRPGEAATTCRAAARPTRSSSAS